MYHFGIVFWLFGGFDGAPQCLKCMIHPPRTWMRSDDAGINMIEPKVGNYGMIFYYFGMR